MDFEAAVRQEAVEAGAWKLRCEQDLVPLLREAVYLQCALGRQPGPLGELSWEHLPRLFDRPDAFRRAIDTQARSLTRSGRNNLPETCRSDAGNLADTAA